MPLTIGLLLGLSFMTSLLALAFLIWAIQRDQMHIQQKHAHTIFTEGEGGQTDEPDAAHHFDVKWTGKGAGLYHSRCGSRADGGKFAWNRYAFTAPSAPSEKVSTAGAGRLARAVCVRP